LSDFDAANEETGVARCEVSGDRACLALASERGLQAITADRSWAGLDVAVEIEIIR